MKIYIYTNECTDFGATMIVLLKHNVWNYEKNAGVSQIKIVYGMFT